LVGSNCCGIPGPGAGCLLGSCDCSCSIKLFSITLWLALGEIF